MKKKKWLIALGSALLLVVTLLLFSPYLFPREVMTVEKIEDISQIAHLDEDDLLMTYELEKNYEVLVFDEREYRVDWGTNQYATLCIFNNGAIYYFNTYKHLYNCMRDNFENEPESIYYLGNLSATELWNLRYLILKTDDNSEKIETDYHYWDMLVEPDVETSAISNNSVDVISEEEMVNQIKLEEVDARLYLTSENSFQIVEHSFGYFHEETTDPHALAALDWLRGTWYFEQYIDLMYQELYPWLVE